jgi:hypothetical protein
MTYKSDKIRDLTPLVTSFVPGESPTAEKLQGMIRQADSAIAYLENKIGDLAGEEGVYNTWVATLARNIGDFSKLNPSIIPNYEVLLYQQPLVAGKVEHELDMIPVGELDDLIESTLDSCVAISQWKTNVSQLEKPGDWTIEFSYIEDGKTKRSRKLVTHSPSEGGSIVFKRVTSGRGSSLELSSENTIPSIAQAESDGPFIELEIIDSFAKTYLVNLPVRTKMYDKKGDIVNFSASNSASAVGMNSQYELPQWFFGFDGLGLDADDTSGFPKFIPLNLITLYDWDTKKEVEGIISLQASPTPSSRKYQFVLQTKQDIILNTATGRYILAVAGNSITNQLKALTDAVYNNTGIGNDMMRILSHKNFLDLRTSSSDFTNRSSFYGPSNINNNDHSMYFHRNGFTANDKGAGGNVIRGDVVVGSSITGANDEIHENFNVDADSFSLYFGNLDKGPLLKYAKQVTYTIDHSYGTLPLGMVDAGLFIQGAQSDLNPTRKNIFLEGDIRTKGNIVLGFNNSDVIFVQGKMYINDEITMIPRSTTGIVGEEGKFLYSSDEKALVTFNGSKWLTPWNYSGFSVTVGDGVTSFGKYNGQTISVFNSALADVASGGIIKVLPGNYNFLGNKLNIPNDVTIEGSGHLTVFSGTGIVFENAGTNTLIKNIKIQNATIGIRANLDNLTISNVILSNCGTAIQVTQTGTNLKVLENVIFQNCSKTIDYPNNLLIPSFQTVMKSAINYNATTVNDWNNKDEILKDYIVSSGTAVITLDTAIDGAIGKGAFSVSGNGNIVSKKLMPVNVNVGIGGHINIRRVGTTGTVSVGVICFGADYNNLGTRYFIASSQDLNNGTIESSFYKNMMIGTSGYTGLMFPVGTRFIQPIIVITGNDGGIQFDSFEIENMSYARVAAWS